jgi:hypothetical protein
VRAALRHWMAWTAVVAVLAGVFALYTRPELMVTLSEQIWSCFGK